MSRNKRTVPSKASLLLIRKYYRPGCSISRSLYLEQVIICHVCGQSGKTLPAAATNTHQQAMTTRLLDHTGNARHVLDGKPAGHTGHG